MSKGKKIICALIATAVIITAVFTLVACKNNDSGSSIDYSATNGTYYRFSDGKANKAEFIILADGKWKDEKNDEGAYEISGTEIKIFSDALGERAELYSGTIADGTLTLRLGGIERVYKRDVSETPVEPGEKIATPTLTVKDYATICWNKVAGAKGYKLTVDEREINVGSDKDSYEIENVAVGSHNAKIVALAETEDCNSDEAELNFNFDLYADGNGTETAPYGIATKEQFYNIKNFSDKYFVIKKQNSFGGTVFDGETVEIYAKLTAEDGAVIDNVTIEKDIINVNADAVADGLKFINVINNGAAIVSSNDGTVRNLSVSGRYFGSISYPTAILIESNDGVAEDCTVSGAAQGFFTAVTDNGSNGVIRNVTADLTVTISSEETDMIGLRDIGFVCGENYGTIVSSVAIGSITFDISYEGNVMGSYGLYTTIGTFVGENDGNISECYSNVDVEGRIYDKFDSIMIGGFAGSNKSEEAVISTSAYEGTFALTVDKDMGSLKIGGFIGTVNAGRIEHCLAANAITITCVKFESNLGWSASNCKYGGFAGRNLGTISDSYAGGLSISGAEGSTNNFSNQENDGSVDGCFVSTDESVDLDGDYWFVPRNGAPVLLALSDVKTIDGACEITRNGNTISWEAVENADYYEYTVNNVKYYTQSTSVTLTFTAKGDYTVTVRPCSDTRLPGERTSISFSVRELAFKVENNGNITEQKYYVGENGSFVVPSFGAVREGHTFARWTVDDVEYAEGDTVTVVEDLILEPKFNINSYKLVVEIRDENSQSKEIYDQDVVYNTNLNSVLDTLSWKIENWDENGYSFIGWKNLYGSSLPENMPARSLTVAADYNINSYTVTLNHNYDGSENIEHTFYYHSSVSYNMSNTPRRGYTFLGWYKDRDCTSGNEMQSIRMPAKNLEFFAKWSLDVFSITVDANDGEYEGEIPAEYTVESEDIVLPTPTKTGYTFGGWSVNGVGRYYTLQKGEFVTDLALKAIFTANEYNVNFDYDGVKVSHIVTFDTTRYNGSKTNYPVSEGSKIFPPYQNKTQDYIIRGWYDNPDLKGKPFDFENATIDRDITLYLKADKIADDVLAAYNAASGAHLGVMRGKLEDISSSNCTYVFIAASADGSEDVDFEAFFIAQGKGLNGDSWEMYYTDLVTNEEFVFRTDGPYTAGSTKTYYSTNRNDGVYTLKNGRAYKFRFRMTTTNTIAVDGYFGPKNAFTYPGEGCAMTNEGKFKVAYDSAIGTLPTLSKTGYTFDGWYVAGDETQTAITADTVLRYTNDITLVPKFTLLTSTISFECDGGTLADGSTLEDRVCSVENPTKYLGELPLVKDGYRFMGWYEDNLFTKRIYYIGYSLYPQGTTIYAYFEKLYYINYVFPEEVNQTKDSTEMIQTETYSLPTIAVDGYRFMGWYTEETFENEITSIDNPTADVTVCAHYEKIYYATFDFGDNGGAWKENSAPATTEYTRLDALDFSNNEVAPPANYQFVGWKINGNEVSINCKEWVIAEGTTADTTFTAVFERRSDGILYNEIITDNVSHLKAVFPQEKGTLEEDVVIPAYVRIGNYRYLPVQSVGGGLSSRNYSINSVTLGSGIEKIENKAFSGIFANYVYIPATVTEIESYAFIGTTVYYNATNNVKLGVNQYMNIMYEGAEWIFDDVEWIYMHQSSNDDANTFTLLKDEWYRPIANVKNFELSDTEDIVNFNDGTIGIAKYKGSDTVIDLTGRNVSYVMPGAYLKNTSITEFRIPANVTVGASAFCGCTEVTKIETATDIDIFGAFCDNYCKEKTNENGVKNNVCVYRGPQTNGSVELVSSAETMTYDLSNLKKTIKSVTLSNITEIKDGLFTDCAYLTEINLTSEKLTNIGANAFAITTTRSTPINTEMTIASEHVVIDSTAFDSNRAISGYVGTSQAYPYIKSYVTATEITVLGTEIQSSAFAQSTFTKVTISSTITSIGSRAFANCKLKTVVFEEGTQLTTIGGGAFCWCYSLGNFEIPSTVTTIGESAFEYCPLTSINIPVGVTSIGGSAFSNCSYLKSVYITDLGAWCNIAFGTAASNPLVSGGTLYLNGEALTDIVVPAEVTELAPFAFTGSKIKSVTISDGVTKIGKGAFYGCTSLESVHIPFSVAAIDEQAFINCTAITAVYITDVNAWSNIQFGATRSNPLSYGATLYVNGEALTDLVVAESATEIKPYAFQGSTIQSVTIPSSVTVIGEGAFDKCANLTSVVFATGSRLTTIGDEAFSGTAIINLIIPATVTTIGDSAFGGAEREPNTTLTSVTFEEGSQLTVMGQKMFYNCTALTSVVLPANLTEIGDSAFYSCSALESIDIPTSVTVIGDSAFRSCSSLTSVELPANLTTICSDAFYSCGALASVNIPATVTSIGKNAFYGCENIASVSITNLLAWFNIDFEYTKSNPLCAKAKLYLNGEELTAIVIPDSVTEIKKNVFAEFAALQSVTLHDNVASIGENAFFGCTSLSSISIPEAVTSISGFAFANTALQTVTIHNKITDIGNSAFVGCSALTSVVFADDSQLTSIGMNAFRSCSSLTSINLPTSVTTLGEYAFRECTSLATVALGSITELKMNTFYNCTSLVNVTLPSSVTAIGNQAFYGCTKLASVKIPDAVTLIGDQAFYKCSALTNVTISGKCVVASIGKDSFSGCTSLKEIRFPITLKKVGENAFSGCTSMATITFGASQSSIEFGRYWKYQCPDTLVVRYNVIYA